jgi:hypothetical protein
VQNIGFADEARAVALQPDGRIVVAGFTEQPVGTKNVLVLRLWQ